MRQQRNLFPLVGLILGLVAVVGYFAVVIQQDPSLKALLEWPVVNLGVLAVGVAFSIAGVRRALGRSSGSPGRRFLARTMAIGLGAVNLGLASLFCWYLFVYSYRLPEAAMAPAVDAPAPAFSLLDQRGQTVELEGYRGRNLLLVFYRGFW